MIECSICDKGPADGVPIFRLDPKGIKDAEWRCRPHMTVEQKVDLDPVVDEIVRIFEEED